ncbi:thiamine pyrophosphate-dependent enzyme [Advenella kashmirensis]
MKFPAHKVTSAHAMLKVFTDNGIDRAYIVPGESYLGVLDALNDFKQLEVMVCRHEGGASFMAQVDGKITGRPGLAMVSRGPGATNAAIGIHAAQQDGTPLILLIGQIPKRDLRKGAFQEIDYQKMFGSVAKWVYEVTAPEDLAHAAFKAIRLSTSGIPGPVVLVVPEDIQQQMVDQPAWISAPIASTVSSAPTLQRIHKLLSESKRPLIIAGGAIGRREGGRTALIEFSEKFNIPVVVSFRQNDLFPNEHRLYAGHLDLAIPTEQLELFACADLLIALGTRLGDITTQGYTFPTEPRPAQTLIHCIADHQSLNNTFVADIGLTADPVDLMNQLMCNELTKTDYVVRAAWSNKLRRVQDVAARWPTSSGQDGIPFTSVARELEAQSPENLLICLDTGTFASSVYKHFSFGKKQRLIASQSGAMGYGIPAATVAQMRFPHAKIVCLVGDGGFLMTGNEIIAAVERQLPILFIISNNNCYGSIRVHQNQYYPDRNIGTSLTNPDFVALARAFGAQAELVENELQIKDAIKRGLSATCPYVIEVKTSLEAALKQASSIGPETELA